MSYFGMDACTETFATVIKFITSITEAACDEGLAWLGTKCHRWRNRWV